MSAPARLYTPELLALTLGLADHPWDAELPLAGRARSKSCGSTLEIGLALDGAGRIGRIGMKVHACAVGQAAAALFATAATGMDRDAIARKRAGLREWLAGTGPMPDWPGIKVLGPARAYPARHGAIMLAWDAALAALSSAPSSS